MDEIRIEYISSELNTLYISTFPYVPQVGKVIRIDEKPFEVTDIEPYFYKEQCKQNKIRVYLEPLKDD